MVARDAGPEQSEGLDWRALIDCAPVATWAEDLSAIAWRFDELRAAGVVDAAAYFSAHPEELSRLARLRRVVAASRPALALFGAGDAEALRERVYDVGDEPCRAALASELAALWHGETLIETEWRVQERVLSRRLAAATMSARGIGHVILAAAGKAILRREQVDWSALVRATAADLRPGFEAKGIALTVSVPETDLWVDGDPTRLAQVLSNLLHNAEKFTDRGGAVHLDLHAVPGARTGRLTVEDTGIGMSPETIAGMFEPFAQADVDLARRRGGVGLGLALAKGLVELHGGSIAASSAGLGRGSRFTVELPLLAVPAQPRPEHAPPAPG